MTRRGLEILAVVLVFTACSQKAQPPAAPPAKPAEAPAKAAPAAPATKPEAAAPEAKAAAKPEAKPEEAKAPEAKAAAKPEAKAAAKPAAKPAAKAATKVAEAAPAPRPAPKPAARPAPAPKAAAPTPLEIAAGKAVWHKHCHLCHRDGTRTKFMGHTMPNLTTAAFQEGVTDAQLRTRISDGYGKPKPDGKTPMPAFAHKLSPKELKDVVAYVRSLRK